MTLFLLLDNGHYRYGRVVPMNTREVDSVFYGTARVTGTITGLLLRDNDENVKTKLLLWPLLCEPDSEVNAAMCAGNIGEAG